MCRVVNFLWFVYYLNMSSNIHESQILFQCGIQLGYEIEQIHVCALHYLNETGLKAQFNLTPGSRD
jgi:hypothetical protein